MRKLWWRPRTIVTYKAAANAHTVDYNNIHEFQRGKLSNVTHHKYESASSGYYNLGHSSVKDPTESPDPPDEETLYKDSSCTGNRFSGQGPCNEFMRFTDYRKYWNKVILSGSCFLDSRWFEQHQWITPSWNHEIVGNEADWCSFRHKHNDACIDCRTVS